MAEGHYPTTKTRTPTPPAFYYLRDVRYTAARCIALLTLPGLEHMEYTLPPGSTGLRDFLRVYSLVWLPRYVLSLHCAGNICPKRRPKRHLQGKRVAREVKIQCLYIVPVVPVVPVCIVGYACWFNVNRLCVLDKVSALLIRWPDFVVLLFSPHHWEPIVVLRTAPPTCHGEWGVRRKDGQPERVVATDAI